MAGLPHGAGRRAFRREGIDGKPTSRAADLEGARPHDGIALQGISRDRAGGALAPASPIRLSYSSVPSAPRSSGST